MDSALANDYPKRRLAYCLFGDRAAGEEPIRHMEPQHIVLMKMPRFLKETLARALAPVASVRVVGELADWSELPAVLDRTDIQWVVASLPPDEPLPEAANLVLSRQPSLRLLNVAADGGHVTLNWIEPHQLSIDEFSMNDLISLLTHSTPAQARSD
jgi:hypothetical protein